MALRKRYMYTSGGKWICIRGGNDTIDLSINRANFDYKTFDVNDYAGPSGGLSDTLMPWEQDWPELNRVGVFPRSTLKNEREGTQTHNVAGQKYENTIFYGKVSGAASNLVYNNCLFLGPPTGETESVVNTNVNANPIIFNDCTFTTQNPNRWASGIKLSKGKTTFNRCDFYGVSDGITPGNEWTNGVYVNMSAFHDFIMYGPDPGAAGGIDDAQTHVDMNQTVGGIFRAYCNSYTGRYSTSTRYMEGNQPPVGFGGTPQLPDYHLFGDRYYGLNGGRYTTSCIMFSPATYPIDAEIDYCWLDGGSYPINGGAMTSSRVVLSNNKIGNKRRDGDSFKTMIAKLALQPNITCTNNVSRYDGTPLTKTDLIANGG